MLKVSFIIVFNLYSSYIYRTFVIGLYLYYLSSCQCILIICCLNDVFTLLSKICHETLDIFIENSVKKCFKQDSTKIRRNLLDSTKFVNSQKLETVLGSYRGPMN